MTETTSCDERRGLLRALTSSASPSPSGSPATVHCPARLESTRIVHQGLISGTSV